MRRIALFIALLALGFGVLFVFFRTPEFGSKKSSEEIPEMEMEEFQNSTPLIDTPTSIVTAEQVTKAVTERITRENGQTVDVLRYVMTFEQGDNKSQRFTKPKLNIYNGEEEPNEKIIACVQSDEGALINEDGASNAAERVELRDIKQGMFEGNVLVQFFDPDGEDHLEMYADSLMLMPENLDDSANKSFSIHVPSQVRLKTVSGQFDLKGTSMWADPERRSFRIEENVSLTLSNWDNPALNSLLGKSAPSQPRIDQEENSEDEPPLVITCRGLMIYRPDQTVDTGEGESLPPGVLQFYEDVVVAKGSNNVNGDSLILSIVKRDEPSDPSKETLREEEGSGVAGRLDIDSIRVVSDSPRRTRFNTETGYGDSDRILWTREQGILSLSGQPKFNVIENPSQSTAGIQEGRQISSSRLIQIIPMESADPDAADQFQLVIPRDARVVDRSQGFDLKSPYLKVDFLEVVKEKGLPGSEAADTSLEVVGMLARRRILSAEGEKETRGNVYPVLKMGSGVEVIGDEIELAPSSSPDEIPAIEVGFLQQLNVVPSEDGPFSIPDIKELVIKPEDLENSPRLTLKDEGVVNVVGRSVLDFTDLEGQKRTLRSTNLSLGTEEETPIRAFQNVRLDDLAAGLTLSGNELELREEEDSESNTIVLRGHPAIVEKEGENSFTISGKLIEISPDSGRLLAKEEAELVVSPELLPGIGISMSQRAASLEASGEIAQRKRITLNAPEIEITSDDRGEPKNLEARQGVCIRDGGLTATSESLQVDLGTQDVTFFGSPLLPAKVTQATPFNSELFDLLEGPQIQVREKGEKIIVPQNGIIVMHLTPKDDSQASDWVEIRSEGELNWTPENVVTRENIKAAIHTDRGTHRFRADNSILTLAEADDQLTPKNLTAKGNVLLTSDSLEGKGDVLFADYDAQTLLLEGRMKPSWLRKKGGTRLVAKGFEVDYKNEEFSAWNGFATASRR